MEGKKKSKHSTRRALILAGGQWREAGIDHFQRRLCFALESGFIFLEKHTALAELQVLLPENKKTNVKSQRSLQRGQNFLMPASQTTSPCVPGWCEGTGCDSSDVSTTMFLGA